MTWPAHDGLMADIEWGHEQNCEAKELVFKGFHQEPVTTAEGFTVYPTPEEKPTNPKDMIGSNKLPMSLFPSSVIAYGCLGFLEGMLKYGLVNWREAGIRISIYLDAAERHHAKFKNGEWADPKTKVPHLSSILACYGIIVDAHTCGKLIDDRPKQAPIGELIESLEPIVPHLKELFKDKNPKHWTIEEEKS